MVVRERSQEYFADIRQESRVLLRGPSEDIWPASLWRCGPDKERITPGSIVGLCARPLHCSFYGVEILTLAPERCDKNRKRKDIHLVPGKVGKDWPRTYLRSFCEDPTSFLTLPAVPTDSWGSWFPVSHRLEHRHRQTQPLTFSLRWWQLVRLLTKGIKSKQQKTVTVLKVV